jgi:hypothetical protein
VPERIVVPEPAPNEERRQLAETIADLHYVSCIVVENASQLVPGEAVDELKLAWNQSEPSMRSLVNKLQVDYDEKETGFDPKVLSEHELFGPSGSLKRSTLYRLKDRFLMYWNSEPRTDEKRAKAAEAGIDYLDCAATVVSSIPGMEKIVEIINLLKQLISIRLKRGT